MGTGPDFDLLTITLKADPDKPMHWGILQN